MFGRPLVRLLSILVIVVGFCDCSPRREREATMGAQTPLWSEEWDLSKGRNLDTLTWEGPGWHAAENEHFTVDGPVQLSILLSEGRRIEGVFGMVRVVSDDFSRDVSLSTLPCSAVAAFKTAEGLLHSLRASEEAIRRLRDWFESGPVSGPGEQLVSYLDPISDPDILGLDIDWVAGSTPEGNWIVTVGFSWD